MCPAPAYLYVCAPQDKAETAHSCTSTNGFRDVLLLSLRSKLVDAYSIVCSICVLYNPPALVVQLRPVSSWQMHFGTSANFFELALTHGKKAQVRS